MKRDKATWRRRAVLAAGLLALVGWVQFAPDLLSFRSDDFVFEDIPDLAPFRWLSVDGATTSGGAMFAGLETRAPLTAEQERLDQRVKADPCRAFYGPARDGPVPVAIFSDFACPNSRVMEARLAEMEADAPDGFRIVRHQLPILGVDSAVASRAVLAAEKQGAYDDMHARLLRSPAVTDATYVTTLAGRIGLDLDRFETDLQSDEIRQTLLESEAIARVFGFFGTPAFAVGQTVFLGTVPTSTLEALIAREADNACQP